MTWSFLLPLIVRYGLEGAYKIFQIISEHGEPTAEAWQKLLALGLKPEADYLRDAMLRAGYAPGAPLPPWVLPPTTPMWSSTVTTISAPATDNPPAAT